MEVGAMSEAEERALRELVPDPVVPAGLAELVERRYTRRRALIVGGAAGAMLATGAGATVAAGLLRSPAPAPSGPGNPDRPTEGSLRDAIQGGRFTTAVAFDRGVLTIAPPPPRAPVVEQPRAISVFRSTGLPNQFVTDVFVGYGTVTMRAALRPNGGMRLDGVPAWVVVYRRGPQSCPPAPLISPPTARLPSRLPAPWHVFLLNPQSGVEAVIYHQDRSVCGQPLTGPSAEVARQYASLPWVQLRRAAKHLTLRYQPGGGCTRSGVTVVRSLSTPQRQEVALLAARRLSTEPCPGQPDATTTLTLPYPDAPVAHAPTGPVTSLYTSSQPERFDFYDGAR
jgi:hypothetical protein